MIKNTRKIKTITISIAMPLFCVVFLSLVDNLYYSMADDYLMNLIARGAFGDSPDPYLIFNSALLGKVLTVFYSLLPSINWYPIFQLGTIAISFSVINYVFINITRKTWEILLITGVLELIVIYHLTFTITSYLCVGAGCTYLIYSAWKEKKIGYIECTFFSFLWLLGDCWRTSTIVTAVFVFIVPFLYLTIIRKKREILFCFVIALCVVGIGKSADTLIYKNSSLDWESYAQYNELRSQVVDYPRLNYEKYQEKFEELGVSENDWQCLYRWVFADREVFSEKTLDEIANMQPIWDGRYNFDIKSIFAGMFSLKYNYCFLIIVLGAVALTEKKYKWGNVLNALCTYGMIAALFVRGRVVLRVMIPIYILGVLSLLIWTSIHKNHGSKLLYWCRNLVVLCVACITCFLLIRNNNSLETLYEEEWKKYDELRIYIEEHPQDLYVASSGVVNPLEYRTTIFQVGEDMDVGNVIKLGSWDIYSKRYYDQLEKYHVENKERLLIALTEESVRYIAWDEEETKMIKKYLEEHLDENIVYEQIAEFPKCDIKIMDISILK